MRQILVGEPIAGSAGLRPSTFHFNHSVNTAQDRFSETIDGKTVTLANWQLSVGGKTIDIPQVESTIIVRRSGGRVEIEVNGKSVYQE